MLRLRLRLRTPVLGLKLRSLASQRLAGASDRDLLAGAPAATREALLPYGLGTTRIPALPPATTLGSVPQGVSKWQASLADSIVLAVPLSSPPASEVR